MKAGPALPPGCPRSVKPSLALPYLPASFARTSQSARLKLTSVAGTSHADALSSAAALLPLRKVSAQFKALVKAKLVPETTTAVLSCTGPKLGTSSEAKVGPPKDIGSESS